MLVALALLVIVVGAARNHASADTAVLLALLATALAVGRWLWIDFRAHPSGFPQPTPSHGLRLNSSAIEPEIRSAEWTPGRSIRFLHIVALAFFVGGQLLLVVAVPGACDGTAVTSRCAASRGASGSGAPSPSSCSWRPERRWRRTSRLWQDDVLRLKLALVVLIGVLIALHIAAPTSRALSVARPPHLAAGGLAGRRAHALTRCTLARRRRIRSSPPARVRNCARWRRHGSDVPSCA